MADLPTFRQFVEVTLNAYVLEMVEGRHPHLKVMDGENCIAEIGTWSAKSLTQTGSRFVRANIKAYMKLYNAPGRLLTVKTIKAY